MTDNLKRFRIEFTVDVHHEGVTKDWDWSNDEIKNIALKEFDNMSPCPFDITFSEVDNPWHTGTPTEDGWYLLECKIGNSEDTYFTTDYWNCTVGYWAVNGVIRWQKVDECEERSNE